MSTPILATKLYIPPPRPRVVLRPRLIDQLNQGLHRQLTLISAPAGFGKTTLVSEWIAECEQPFIWLSLDESDHDPARFLTYLIAAFQSIANHIGAGLLGLLQAPQPPPAETILTTLLNEISAIPHHFVLVLDDYHVIDSQQVDKALTFLLKHLPPQMHMVIITREDPQLPLARLRARGQLIELRVKDLRFTLAEVAEFLNQVMGLTLTAADIEVMEQRTEGWIAGLQLAALSMQGHQDIDGFIRSFTGSHHFVMDYLVEEVLHQQPESVQTFLLHTSLLDRMCGPLCDAVLLTPAGTGQETLAYLEQANLFIIPLDNERRWYRYHHLFAELLRQRLHQSLSSSPAHAERGTAPYHIRASQWYEDNSLEFEAFRHAAAAHDIDRVERLIAGEGIPRHLRGAVTAILDWFASVPIHELNARPALWWRYASLMLVNGQTTGVDEKLDSAEALLHGTEPDDQTRNLIGRIALARATLALTRYQTDTMIVQAHRALEYLAPTNLALRANAHWALGLASFMRGLRTEARQAFHEAIAISRPSGNVFTTILATIGLGGVQESENELYQAADTYRSVLQVAGNQPLQIIHEAHLGLARILYEWNDIEAAERHGQQSLQLARLYDNVIDRFILCELFLVRLKLAQGDITGAAAILAQTHQTVQQKNFVHRLPEVAAAQVLVLLRQGHVAAAAHLAQSHDLPFSQARVHLAQGHTASALALLQSLRETFEARRWQDERLKVMVLQAVAFFRHGETPMALQVLSEALALAAPGGFIRLFVDEGPPMAQLLSHAADTTLPNTISQLLAAFDTVHPLSQDSASRPPLQPLIEPLSQRELEILALIAQGLSNHQISERLFLALSTVKGHNQKIFDKLQVERRTEAVARARALGLL